MKTQTSIDWLAKQNDLAIMHFLSKINHPAIEAEAAKAAGELGLIIKTSLQTARKMHREEVKTAYIEGNDDGLDRISGESPLYRNASDYYSQNFETP